MTAGASAPEPIAIVGIGCRLPGGADDPRSLWRLLLDRFDAIDRIPSSRLDVDALFDPHPATPGRIMSEWGGFLTDIEDFDADFFGIAPREAERLDPQQRLLLETTWEALEDAGIPADRVAGAPTGVFVGLWLNDLEGRLFADTDDIDFHMTTGTGRYAASGRLSYFFDLLGPSITVDTACSSSLVAVHLACQSLWSGESDLALAGGANVILQPSITIAYSQSRMMAPDGRCKFGDAAGDGYVRSEGAAMVALKRLSSARAAGDRIHAVIRGSAVTNDGRSSGYLATPGQAGQEEMLRRAYSRSGVDPATVQYVEAHGTGTAAGDPVELGALGAVVGAGREPDRPFYVGSIKTNVGHTEGAAGVAGLIKVALALEHGEIPPSLHMTEPNPNIAWRDLGLEVCTDRRPWAESEVPARAGVSAFGIAGTNAHVVLEAAPSAAVGERPADPADTSLDPIGTTVLPISARSEDALRELAARYAALLGDDDGPLREICAAAALQRSHLEHRLAVVASEDDAAEMAEALAGFIDGAERPDITTGVTGSEPLRVVFVFPGQGSQWVGMARELLRSEPVFRAAIERCDRAIRDESGWSPLEVLDGAADDRLDEIDVVQPLLFAVQVALAAQWEAWGVVPDAVVGHSMGEVAAAHVSGALSLDDAVTVICCRSRLLRRVAGEGAMAVVDLPVDDARVAIAEHADRLAIAVSNSPRSTVISGDPSAVDAVLADLRAADVFCRPVKVDVASHSPQMDPLVDDLRAGVAEITPRAGRIEFQSTVDGGAVDGVSLGPDYWTRNLRRPVLFGDAVERLAQRGRTVFVEIGPHPILLPAIDQTLSAGAHDGGTVASLRRDEPERATMLTGLGALYTQGVDVDWSAVLGEAHRHVELPHYPWQRERYWHEPRGGTAGRSGGHPLLGHGVGPAASPGTVHWETDLARPAFGFLAGHVVASEAIMPAAGFVELARCAAEQTGATGYVVVDVDLVETLPYEPDHDRALQLSLEAIGSDRLRLRVFSRRCEIGTGPESAPDAPGADTGVGGGWRLHATATLLAPSSPSDVRPLESIEVIRARCATGDREPRGGDAHYAAMHAVDLDYSGAFRTVGEHWLGEREALGRLHVPDGAADPAGGRIQIVDGALQLAVAAVATGGIAGGGSFLPVHIDRIDVLDEPLDSDDAWAHVIVLDEDATAGRCDVTIRHEGGAVIAAIHGVELRRVGPSSGLDGLLYELRWVPAERTASAADSVTAWIVYADGGVGADLADRLRAAGDTCIIATPGETFELIDDHALRIDGESADEHRALLRHGLDIAGSRPLGIVYAWAAGIEPGDPDAVPAATSDGCASPIALVQAIGEHFDAVDDPTIADAEPRLWLVTRAAQPLALVADDPAAPAAPHQGVLWGLGRVIANERPSLRCTLVDVASGASDEAEQLFHELRSGADDRQIALEGVQRSVATLDRRPAPSAGAVRRTIDTDEYRLVASQPGSLDHLRLRAQPRRPLASDEIEVRIDAAGINFLDVLKAMGIYPGLEASPDVALGAECAGVVVAIGDGVHDHSVGDDVVAITPSYGDTAMLASHVSVPAAFAVRRPEQIPAAEASALPVAYVTAYYGLVELARLRAGERVLVHSATGGVGLAAIELCRHLGAEVIATAGSDEKRELLRSRGIEHVFDSRTIDFAGHVLDATGGRGVDVVLNSLVGEAITAGLSTLAPRGRFIEIGKRDVYADTRIGLEPFKDNRSLHVVDVASMTEQDPQYVARLFSDVMGLVADHRLPTLPITTAEITSAAEVFRTMAGAGHVGKLVLTVPNTLVPADIGPVRADSTYLVTGGLGALGLATAERLVDIGARHLALLGRSAPSDHAAAHIDGLRRRGVDVRVVAVDVTDADALGTRLAEVRATMPPLRGVVHAAGALADATIAEMDRARLRAALDPKLAGGWNLHQATLDDPLDLFVMFSSVAGVLGLTGQSNYAAGNAFLDSLAAARRAVGRPGLSIDWGPWADIGLAAAAADRGDRLAERGLHSVSPGEALDAFERLLDDDRAQAVVMRLDATRWIAGTQAPTLVAETAGSAATPTSGDDALRDRLAEAPAGARRRLVMEEAVRAQLAPVLRVAPERIDRNRPLEAMGLDSLMSLEFRNRLEVETGLKLSATLAFNYPTVAHLAAHLADRMNVALDSTDTPDVIDQPPASTEPASTDVASGDPAAELSDDDVERLLGEELAAVDRLLDGDGRAQ